MRFGGQSLLQKVLTEGTPGPKVSTHSTCWMAESEDLHGVAECREVEFSLRLPAEKLIPRFKNIVL